VPIGAAPKLQVFVSGTYAEALWVGSALDAGSRSGGRSLNVQER
jgi:hypothetical protein